MRESRKKIRRDEACKRTEIYRLRTPRKQKEELDDRLGVDQGAKKERLLIENWIRSETDAIDTLRKRYNFSYAE